jgi:diguanylate cyclase (GGDEF)-like protein/PAS domain S-box-containing protein
MRPIHEIVALRKDESLTLSGRTSLVLAILSVSVLFCTQWLGLVPADDTELTILHRRSESLSHQCAALVSTGDASRLPDLVNAFLHRHGNLLAITITKANEKTPLIAMERPADGRPKVSTQSVNQPIMDNDQSWGTLHAVFEAGPSAGLVDYLTRPFTQLLLLVAAVNTLLFLLYLPRAMPNADATTVVPDRVRSALNNLAEGLLIIDTHGRIAMANSAFARIIGRTPQELLGHKAEWLSWERTEGSDYPWYDVLKTGHERVGVPLSIRLPNVGVRNFMVNASPIRDDHGRPCGVLASFDDVTILQEKKSELILMLDELQKSRDRIHEQNQELQILVTKDPLTGCLNRRSFFEQFEKEWEAAERYSQPLSCMMVDIDFFKVINDTHGHAMGDEVLRQVGATLLNTVRQSDLVCRYGGEEFCVLLPHLDIEEAFQAAERFRQILASLPFPKLSITASFGVSSISLGASSSQEILDQADKALYVAKRSGRNRVTRFDRVPNEVNATVTKSDRQATATRTATETETETNDNSIPYRAVAALMSALAFRDSETAAHSMRVADLCVLCARGLLSAKETYLLEIAALLHDVGKIGVPDAILFKQGKLTTDEWEKLRSYDSIGIEIIRSSFDNKFVLDVISHYRLPFGGDPAHPSRPAGTKLPIGGRLLAIADAFDSMVTDHFYRPGKTKDEALAELQTCGRSQFDPELVQWFTEATRHHTTTGPATHGYLSKESAIQMGLQIEHLADAVDKQDLQQLATLATRLESTASQCQAKDILSVAQKIRQCVERRGTWHHVSDLSLNLVDLARNTKWAHVPNTKRQEATISLKIGTRTPVGT